MEKKIDVTQESERALSLVQRIVKKRKRGGAERVVLRSWLLEMTRSKEGNYFTCSLANISITGLFGSLRGL